MSHVTISSRPMPEKNDCTVRALEITLEIPYLTAYGMVLGGASRKRNRGVRIEQFYDSMFPTKINEPGATVERFIKEFIPFGRWIVKVRGHVFAVIDGKIHDTYPLWNLNRHVVCAWRVK